MIPVRDTAMARRGRLIRRHGHIWLAPVLALALVVALLAFAGASSESVPAKRGPTLGVAKVFLARGDFESAERILRQLDGPEPKFLLGKLLTGRGRWAEARGLLIEAASDPDRRNEALRLLAQGSMDHSDWAGALEFLRGLEKADPKDRLILKALALCIQRSGDALGALAAAQRGLEVAPGDRELLTIMSEAAEASALSAARPRSPDGLPQPLRYGRRSR